MDKVNTRAAVVDIDVSKDNYAIMIADDERGGEDSRLGDVSGHE